MPDGGILQLDPPMLYPHYAWGDATRVSREEVKLERSPGWNPVRAERSKFCIYAYVGKPSKAAVNKVIDNTCDLEKESATAIANRHQADEYSRSEVKVILDIAQGESRRYWKYHGPDKKFNQAKAVGKINNAKATLLFDSGAEVSILDTAFARKVGCYVDNSQALQCEGVAKSPYMTEGRTRPKITLAGSLAYFSDAWVGLRPAAKISYSEWTSWSQLEYDLILPMGRSACPTSTNSAGWATTTV
ncbi:unnamed protein product [Phytophthora fragariaefolia]|uniref:Unnamed protein product n=1 Tax=Phytophthora fragariaefolia TaxID=1490495 RepID=A0A9W6XKX0_9STRA|nr:unnamed protein product [Phytophthora fragariaefolia]